jgi:peptidoglycan L-alanyl-D-glutamate endopeptidase CwlK
MTYKFSKRSKDKINTCHRDIQIVCHEVIKGFDFTVIEGARSTETQQEYYRQGRSHLDGIKKKSKHQIDQDNPLSNAIDIAPYPIDWNDKERFYYFAGYVKGVIDRLFQEGKIKSKFRWGGDWNGDNDLNNQTFFDLPHWERI